MKQKIKIIKEKMLTDEQILVVKMAIKNSICNAFVQSSEVNQKESVQELDMMTSLISNSIVQEIQETLLQSSTFDTILKSEKPKKKVVKGKKLKVTKK